MKYSSITVLALATTILAASCQNEKDMSLGNDGMTICAVSEGIGVASKADMVYGYEVLWKDGDRIRVKNSEKSVDFILVDGFGTSRGIFSSFYSISGEVEGFYPSDVSGLIWPAEQQIDQIPPMYCKKNLSSVLDQTFNFSSLGSVLQLLFSTSAEDITLSSIELSADEAMSGAFTVTDGKAVITQSSEGDKPGITLDLGKNGVTVGKSAKKFNISIPSGTYHNLTISFAATDGTECRVKVDTVLTIDHNTVYNLPTSGDFAIEASGEVDTGAATQVSCRNAVLAGKSKIQLSAEDEFTLGILYSTTKNVVFGYATEVKADSFDSEYNFTVTTDILGPSLTYYYRAFLIHNSEVVLGEIKSFETLPTSSMIQTLDATEINPKDAVLNAALDLDDCKYNEMACYFMVTPEGGDPYTVISDNYSKKEKKFSVKDESLHIYTNYSVEAYVMLDNHLYKGDVKAFATLPVAASVTAASSDITRNAGMISGKFTVNSKGLFTKSATLYYSSTSKTQDALKSGGEAKAIPLQTDGSYSLPASGLAPTTQYYYCVVAKVDDVEFVSSVGSFKTLEYPVPEVVDLGLSVKWASFNLGAASQEESGDYIQWAGTADVSYTDDYLGWEVCPYHNGTDASDEWMKYNTKPTYGTVDNKTDLETEDDVATSILGEDWRMPTFEEWEELRLYCAEVEWTTVNGVPCKKLTSAKNGKSIILPATGYRDGDSIENYKKYGYYWSSTLQSNTPEKARCVRVEPPYVVLTDDYRYRGFAVRPVYKY